MPLTKRSVAVLCGVMQLTILVPLALMAFQWLPITLSSLILNDVMTSMILVQNCWISSALAMEILQSSTKPSKMRQRTASPSVQV